ncbi:hypothetical protein E9993_01580 [Labilibacter sediminis]|nr:hypothetical protein E9993_01580 [Labilibacter sediminis]
MIKGKKILVVHCSDSDYKTHDDISVIRKWHVEERNFVDVGYHFFIKKDGTIQKGRKLKVNGAHCRGINSKSWGVCLSGKSNSFTQAQMKALEQLTIQLSDRIRLVDQHSAFDAKKPFCAGLNDNQVKYLNNLVNVA